MRKLNIPRDPTGPRTKQERIFLEKIGRNLKKSLYDLRKSVDWLAVESGTSRATVRRIMDGERNVGILTLDRIARALGYRDVTDFLGRL